MKVGLIVDGYTVPEYVRDLVQWSQTQDRVSVTHLIIQRIPAHSGSARTGGKLRKLITMVNNKGWRKASQTALWSLIVKMEAIRLRRMRSYGDFLKPHSVKEFGLVTIEADITVSKSGLVYRYPESVLSEIRAAGIDVLIRCGSGILRGGILDCCRHGVLSFHHGDNRVKRGAPSAFWEVYSQEATTGFVIQRLTEELDGGEVLLAGNIPTKTFYYLNQVTLYRKASAFLQRLLYKLAAEGEAPSRDSSPYYNRLYKDPTALQLIGYLWSAYVLRALRRGTRRILGRKLRWGIAYIACGDWTKAVLHKGIRIPNPRKAFLADPFVASFKGEECIFAEEFCDERGKAHISAFKHDGVGFNLAGRAVQEPFHLSFPFVFEFEGRLFMCPESSESRDIRLYECTDYPCGWKLHSIPFSNASAVDTIIFENAGSWWLFSNIDSADIADRSELHVFRANDPISGTWEPHRNNPVIFDSRCSRNAGLLRKDDRIYRLSQGHGFGTYGVGMSIQEIVELSINRYVERTYATIEPGFFNHVAGTHTFSAAGGWVAFDFLADFK